MKGTRRAKGEYFLLVVGVLAPFFLLSDVKSLTYDNTESSWCFG